MGKLSGKTAIVTGASKGIGAAIAEDLAANGASVVVNYATSKSGAEAVVERITKAGGKAIAVGANVGDPKQVAKLIEETISAFGKIDILVNNAGIYEFAPLQGITPEHFHKQFDLNVLGGLTVTQAAVPHFPDEGGSIINISSAMASQAPVGTAIYSATKAAIDAITLVLAKELGPRKIRVNSVSPGFVATEGSSNYLGGDLEKRSIAVTPLGRVGQPAEIATAVTFFASDDSRWISAEITKVSGGAR